MTRPKVFISQIDPKSNYENIIYTLENSGQGTAYDINIKFQANIKYFDKNKILLKEESHPLDAKSIDHLYGTTQKKEGVLTFKLTESAKQKVVGYTVKIKYKITYYEKQFLFYKKFYSESGKFALNPGTKQWLNLLG